MDAYDPDELFTYEEAQKRARSLSRQEQEPDINYCVRRVGRSESALLIGGEWIWAHPFQEGHPDSPLLIELCKDCERVSPGEFKKVVWTVERYDMCDF